MRKRSMSVYAARDDDRLSKKFEGVASDNEAHYDSEDETKDEGALSDEWSRADYDSLLTQLRETLPKKDYRKWKTSLQSVNWDEIKIRQHTAQEVETVAKQLIGKIRSFRTLSEILDDAPEVVGKMLSAERPKPPLTIYSLYVKDVLPKLREQHKDLKVQDIFKLVPKLFHELSAKKRRRYEDKAAVMKKEYQANLSKFYEEHPDLMPKRTRKEPLKTPFQLFYQSRRATSDNISCQQVRKEWEQLPLKNKVKFIQMSFEAQSETDSKLLNKKELKMLDEAHGKPEFIGRNAYEFYRRKMKAHYDKLNKAEREQQIRADYKNLSSQEQLKLKEEFLDARNAFVQQYQEYIKKLPKDKQQAEIEFLKTISEKAAKKSKTPLKNSAKDDSAGSADESPPVAESTTINKKMPSDKKAKKKHKIEPEDSEPIEHHGSPKKAPKSSTGAAPSTSKTSALLSISKSEPPASSSSSSDEDDEEDERNASIKQLSTSRKRVPVSPKKNGSARTNTETKKRVMSDEDVKPDIELKKPKKSAMKEEKEEEEEEPKKPPSSALKAAKSAKTKDATALTVKEPVKPPKDVEEFYRQKFYKGKPGKHAESFANLTMAKKREIGEQLKAAQKQYILDFEMFLKSLPKDEIRKYIQRVNAQKQADPSDDDSDEEEEEEDDAEEESSEEDDD